MLSVGGALNAARCQANSSTHVLVMLSFSPSRTPERPTPFPLAELLPGRKSPPTPPH